MASQGMAFTLVGGPSQLCWLKCRVVTLLLFFDLLEIETDIEINLPDMKTTLPEIKTDLHEIKTALPEIEILFYELDNK